MTWRLFSVIFILFSVTHNLYTHFHYQSSVVKTRKSHFLIHTTSTYANQNVQRTLYIDPVWVINFTIQSTKYNLYCFPKSQTNMISPHSNIHTCNKQPWSIPLPPLYISASCSVRKVNVL